MSFQFKYLKFLKLQTGWSLSSYHVNSATIFDMSLTYQTTHLNNLFMTVSHDLYFGSQLFQVLKHGFTLFLLYHEHIVLIYSEIRYCYLNYEKLACHYSDCHLIVVTVLLFLFCFSISCTEVIFSKFLFLLKYLLIINPILSFSYIFTSSIELK